MVVGGAVAGHGCHGDAVGELHAADVEGSEEFGHFGIYIVYIVFDFNWGLEYILGEWPWFYILHLIEVSVFPCFAELPRVSTWINKQ